MLNYHRAIYKTIDDEIQVDLIMIVAIYKTINDETQLCLVIQWCYMSNNRWWNTTLLNYHSGIYKTINDEIKLCLIMIELYIKQ